MYAMCDMWQARGGVGCIGDHIQYCRSFTLCMGTDSESTKLPDHPEKKPRRGGGLRKINNCRKVLLLATCKTKRFCIAFYESYSSTGLSLLLLPHTRRDWN
jgi:hypothetical protein